MIIKVKHDSECGGVSDIETERYGRGAVRERVTATKICIYVNILIVCFSMLPPTCIFLNGQWMAIARAFQ